MAESGNLLCFQNCIVAGLYLRNASGNNCIPAHLAGIHVTAQLVWPLCIRISVQVLPPESFFSYKT